MICLLSYCDLDTLSDPEIIKSSVFRLYMYFEISRKTATFIKISNFYKVFQDNLRNRWANVLRLVPRDWISESYKPIVHKRTRSPRFVTIINICKLCNHGIAKYQIINTRWNLTFGFDLYLDDGQIKWWYMHLIICSKISWGHLFWIKK